MMRINVLTSAALGAMALHGGQSLAQQMTRERAQAQYIAAAQAGTLPTGAAALDAREIAPGLYPALPQAAGETRSEVRAELAAAQRAGVVVQRRQGMAQRDLLPAKFPPPAPRSGQTREEVQAELAAAQRSGNLRLILAGVAPRPLQPGKGAGGGEAAAERYLLLRTFGIEVNN
jgi:hypothetical protein